MEYACACIAPGQRLSGYARSFGEGQIRNSRVCLSVSPLHHNNAFCGKHCYSVLLDTSQCPNSLRGFAWLEPINTVQEKNDLFGNAKRLKKWVFTLFFIHFRKRCMKCILSKNVCKSPSKHNKPSCYYNQGCVRTKRELWLLPKWYQRPTDSLISAYHDDDKLALYVWFTLTQHYVDTFILVCMAG